MAGATHRRARTPALRTWVGRLAWGAAICFALGIAADAMNNLYSGVNTLRRMPKGYVVMKSAAGMEISSDAQEWNAHAWKLATDSDVNQRDPAEAVRLAERAVEAEPKNAAYLNTLGVARYRAGDFRGSINALKHSFDVDGVNARGVLPGDGSCPARPPQRCARVVRPSQRLDEAERSQQR